MLERAAAAVAAAGMAEVAAEMAAREEMAVRAAAAVGAIAAVDRWVAGEELADRWVKAVLERVGIRRGKVRDAHVGRRLRPQEMRLGCCR